MSTFLVSGRRYVGIGGAARLFFLLAVTVPIVWSLDQYSLVGLLALAAIWMAGITAAGLPSVPPWAALLVEAGFVSAVVGSALPHTILLTPALAVAPLISGSVHSAKSVLGVAGFEICVIALMALQLGWRADSQIGSQVFSWLAIGLGAGLLAAFARSIQRGEIDDLTPYRDARALIGRLLDISGELTEGLDPSSIGQKIADRVYAELPLADTVVVVRQDDVLIPLVQAQPRAGAVPTTHDELVERVWATAAPASTPAGDVAFPLTTDAGVVAVVAGFISPALASRLQLQRVLAGLTKMLRPEALQLDTALLFSAVRSDATADERRRLAREVHDGVAQDIASLGYLVDDLQESATSEAQAQLFGTLRSEITSVVAELRRSVFSLRNEATGSLGAGIGELARHVTTVTGIPVHLSIDEGPTRLRAEVEAELLRITQEAMNNAVKHAQPHSIRVQCTVKAPSAEVVVTDDGRGLGPGRHDSHGLRIMHERAQLIGASITLENGDRGGTVVRVCLARASSTSGDAQDPGSPGSPGTPGNTEGIEGLLTS
jgi:signal transduction histidine kinase